MGGVGEKPVCVHPQAFLFQTEIPLQQQFFDPGRIRMEHGHPLPFPLSHLDCSL